MAHVKTAVSIEESLFEEAEAWAGKLGISRGRLFADAVREYVRRRENEELLRRLNGAHAGGLDEEDEQSLRHMQALHLQTVERLEREVEEER